MANRFMLAPLTNWQSNADGTLADAEYHWLTMRARGGFEIDAAWKNGKLTTATVKSLLGKELVLRLPGNPQGIYLTGADGKPAELVARDGIYRIPTVRGQAYRITFP
jgi:hypothetical protein